MTLMRSTMTGISARTTVYAEREMLRHAAPVTVLDKFGVAKRMPKNKGLVVVFRRPIPFTAATTPLVEGVTPNAVVFAYENVSVTLKQYGEVVAITDVIEDTLEDPVLNDASKMSGENIGRTVEALTYGVLRAGTNVFYANGTTRVGVNTPITLNKQRAVVRALKAQKADMIRSMLSGSVNYNTSPIEGAYVAVAHTDLEADLRGLPGFVPVAQYGARGELLPMEIGSVENVRYCLSPDLEPFRDAGGAKGNMVSQSGTNADVYPILYFGRDAYGTVAIRGLDAVEPTIIPVGQKTKDDPLGQRGYVGWKTWFAAIRLNEAWMARMEVAVTAL